VLGAIGVFVIEREFARRGFRARGRGADLLRLHARRGVGIGRRARRHPSISLGYLLVAGCCSIAST
jgi:hypothetical protein